MAYEKQTWLDGQSPLNAERMNHMEGGIEGAHAELKSLNEEIVAVTPKKFGAVGDGVADDSDAIQSALNVGGLVYLPAGRYKITKTLTIGSNTTLMGDGDNSAIYLGDDGASLTPHDWYIDSTTYPQYYPYITTAENANNIRISHIRVEGNTETSSTNLHVGIAVESATDVQIDHVSIWKINYHPELAPPRPSGQWRTGWNIAFLRSDRIELAHSTIQYGAYECVRIGTIANDVWVHDCLIEYGWRTGLQIIEGCSRITVERCTINQDDFDACDTNSCVTMHPSDKNPIKGITIRSCKLTGKLFTGTADGAGIHAVWPELYDLTVEKCTLNITAQGLPAINASAAGKVSIIGCDITSTFSALTVSVSAPLTVRDSNIYSDNTAVIIYKSNAPSIFEKCTIESTTKAAVYMTKGEIELRDCVIRAADMCIAAVPGKEETEPHFVVRNCELYTGVANAISVKAPEDALTAVGTSFEIETSRLYGAIYLSMPNMTLNRPCRIVGNFIKPAKSSSRCISNDFSSTAYKLLTIKDNVLTGGSEAIKIWSAGLAVITGNNVAGCASGISATNESNVVEHNFA